MCAENDLRAHRLNPMNTPQSRYYTIKEVAERYRVSTKTVRNWIKKRLLATHTPPTGATGRHIIRFAEHHLAAFDRMCERPAITATSVGSR